jgi:hypothetical protein
MRRTRGQLQRGYLCGGGAQDVSVGLWLAPLNLTRWHDVRFDTEWKVAPGCALPPVVYMNLRFLFSLFSLDGWAGGERSRLRWRLLESRVQQRFFGDAQAVTSRHVREADHGTQRRRGEGNAASVQGRELVCC